jgi:anti-anti-sigma factor
MKIESDMLAGDVRRIGLEGRLDIDGVHAAEARFTELATADPGRVVVDLAGVSLLASIGLRLLLAAARGQKARGGRLALAAARPAVRKVLLSAGIDRLMPVFDDLESARASLVSA